MHTDLAWRNIPHQPSRPTSEGEHLGPGFPAILNLGSGDVSGW
jgi:hypothetical protein